MRRLKKTIISNSEEETQKIAEKMINKLNTNIISLEGELGGGKTTFVKGIARSLSIKEKIKSPTFVIMKKYRILTQNKRQTKNDKGKNGRRSKVVSCKFRYLYHFDCYRLVQPKEILEITWEKIIKNEKNLAVIEWGDKIKNILPKNTLHIKFDFLSENSRKIQIYF